MANILDMKGKGGEKKSTPAKKQVSIKQSTSIECVECGHDIYLPAVHLRKIPKIMVGAPQDVIIPIDVFLCANCGTLCKDLLPEEIREFFK